MLAVNPVFARQPDGYFFLLIADKTYTLGLKSCQRYATAVGGVCDIVILKVITPGALYEHLTQQ